MGVPVGTEIVPKPVVSVAPAIVIAFPSASVVKTGNAYPWTTFPPLPSVTVIFTRGLTKEAVQVTDPFDALTLMFAGPVVNA